jgi:hypothetical protein
MVARVPRAVGASRVKMRPGGASRAEWLRRRMSALGGAVRQGHAQLEARL